MCPSGPAATVRLSLVPRTPGAVGTRRGEPVSVGLPFARSVVTTLDHCAWTDDGGRVSPVQAEILERWPDGSVRWALLHGRATWDGTPSTLLFDTAPTTHEPERFAALTVTGRAAGAIVVDTGAARFEMSPGSVFPFDRVSDPTGRDIIDAAASGLRVVDQAGRTLSVRTVAVAVEVSGPQIAVVRGHGVLVAGEDTAALEYDSRLTFFAGSAVVKLSLTIRNPKAAVHPGNFWELGDPASALLRDCSLVLALVGSPDSVSCSIDPGAALAEMALPFALYQESSGGEHWDSPVHVNRAGRVVQTLAGYRMTSGAQSRTGRRATPVVRVSAADRQVAAAVPAFWENCPRAVSVSGSAIRIGFWPAEYPDLHELQGGEQKTHVCWLAFGSDSVCDVPLDWCRQPALVHAEPAYYAAAEALPFLTPEAADESSAHRAMVRSAIEGHETFVAKRERSDEYGWRHFGDLYADHESVFAPADRPLVSHYNNQYDAVGGFATQFLRSGDARWWSLMDDLAAHVVDIDIYHATGDKAAYSGGPFWHTCHYVDAGRSTHRAYPNAPGVGGGGPSNEHAYTGGLVLHYLLTGDLRSRAAVLQVADWVIRMDDGRLSPFRVLARGETGLASMTRETSFHGPGRGAGNAMAVLLDAYRLSSRAEYLEKAEALIRRCVHPADDVAASGLLDAENRWSYTVFLQVLSRYLREQAEAGRLGAMYRWARESLLTYARWMVLHERPYLDEPENLEYPTETWAAQDLRKGDVLLQASLHAVNEDERARFRDRATFFHESAVRTLASLPTRTLTRPVVLLLSNGANRTWFAQRPTEALPAPVSADAFGRPRRFVPQRARALSRARWIVGGVGAATLAVVVRWLL